jgi:protein-L-isoaspartate(D-aspartate) O-methyltransferase
MSAKLADFLVERGALSTRSLIDAFRDISRKYFVPSDLEELADADVALPIGSGQTISQPSTVAFMLELLSPQAGDRILDVGSGSGWTTALLAHAAGERGSVIALERLPELVAMTSRNVRRFGYLGTGRVKVIEANGEKGYPDRAPYDRILVSAAGPEVPSALKAQLKVGGTLVMPVNDRLHFLAKKSDNEFLEEDYPGFVFVPFIRESV